MFQLFFVLWHLLAMTTVDVAASHLRSTTPEWERTHVIRRIYGPQNAYARGNVSFLEERMERYRTGFNGDANHIVPYLNHPYQQALRERNLQSDNSTNATDATNATLDRTASLFENMRIKFFYDALEAVRNSNNSAKIDWIINEVLPRTAEFWSSALKVVPVNGNLKISTAELDSRMYCGDSEFTEVPADHISNGVPDADLILYVSASNSVNFCPDRTLAVAVPCNFDQFDRPTAGAVNVCLDNIVLKSDGTAAQDVLQDYIDVSIHETGHVLACSSNSYRFYWDPKTGKPRTPRPFAESTIQCVSGATQTILAPSEDTMAIIEENGVRYASIVTEKVRQVARNQFDCQGVEGGRLENQDTRDDSCFGDHWDERLYYPETMTAIISPTTNIFSSLTLALMEDSGWYLANYTVTKMSPWGLGAGCSFPNDLCLVPGDPPQIPEYSTGFFCAQESEKGCSPELTHKLACSVVDYQYYVPQTLPPEPFVYFTSTPSKGGPVQADYCPIYGSPYNGKSLTQLSCQDPSNADSFNLYSEVFGEDSRCIKSALGEGLCLRTVCVQDEMKVRINVRGEWLTCDYDGQELSITVGQGLLSTSITCPRLAQVCPELYCPFNCAGRGVCNYAYTNNSVVRPKCECFDTNDTTPGCSDSLIPDGGFLSNSSGLFDNIQQNFFDPLIAVFVDHPSTWSTQTWAWAGGLIAVFVILLLCICSSCCPGGANKRV